MPEKGNRDREELVEPVRPVDPRGLVESRVAIRHAGQQQNGAEPQQDPDSDEADGRKSPVEIPEPGTSDDAEALEDLVDQPGKGQQPAPDDPGRDNRDDLGEEQNGPAIAPRGPVATRCMTLAATSPSVTGMKLKSTTNLNAL